MTLISKNLFECGQAARLFSRFSDEKQKISEVEQQMLELFMLYEFVLSRY